MNKAVIQIPQELSAPAESFAFSGTLDLPEISTKIHHYLFTEPLSYDVQLTNVGSSLLLTGKVRGHARSECARCLDDFEQDFEGEIIASFVEDITLLSEEEEDGDIFPIPQNKCIELEPILISSLILEFPMVALCSDDCRGLCAYCGTNLNYDSCEHSRQCVDEES